MTFDEWWAKREQKNIPDAIWKLSRQIARITWTAGHLEGYNRGWNDRDELE